MKYKDMKVGERYVDRDGTVLFMLEDSHNEETSVLVSEDKDADYYSSTSYYESCYNLEPYKQQGEKEMEQNPSVVYVKVINVDCHKDLTYGKIYEAVYEPDGEWYRILKDDVGDGHDVWTDEVGLVEKPTEAPTLGGEVLKQKLEKLSKYEQCADKCPKLWGALKDELNDEALESLVDVILNGRILEDSEHLGAAFIWNDTKQGVDFWAAVGHGKYNKDVVTAISEPSIASDSVVKANTQDNKENAAGSDCVAGKGMSAPEFCNKAEMLMRERAATYDKDGNFEGERSAGKIAIAFNAITGHNISESEAWLFLQIMKDVRQWSTDIYHSDSAEDCVAYAALKAEALAKGV